MILAFILEY